MNLQLQLKRGLIALAIWAVLGGIALTRAGGAVVDAEDQHMAALRASLHAKPDCSSTLRIDFTPSLRLTLPCDRSCAPVRGVMRALHLSVSTRSGDCLVVRTA